MTDSDTCHTAAGRGLRLAQGCLQLRAGENGVRTQNLSPQSQIPSPLECPSDRCTSERGQKVATPGASTHWLIRAKIKTIKNRNAGLILLSIYSVNFKCIPFVRNTTELGTVVQHQKVVKCACVHACVCEV